MESTLVRPELLTCAAVVDLDARVVKVAWRIPRWIEFQTSLRIRAHAIALRELDR